MSDDTLKTICATKKYCNINKIAQGGMGIVYSADQIGMEEFKKVVAIKTILPKYAEDENFVRHFIGEAKLVADLIHENIVQVYQLEKTDDMLYMVMEYVDGKNLEQFEKYHWENEIPIDPKFGTFIISRVARALEYAHNKKDIKGKFLGIVHRDISPKNIMISFEGVVKVTDFGIAKAAQIMEQEEGKKLSGKVKYMSPEQASFQITDCRSDIFSLGIVYYELLTGHHPFDAFEPGEILENVKSMQIPDPRNFRPDLSKEIVDLLLKMLERDLGKRIQTGRDLSISLEKIIYAKGYGPTNQSLGVYMKKHFHPTEDDSEIDKN